MGYRYRWVVLTIWKTVTQLLYGKPLVKTVKLRFPLVFFAFQNGKNGYMQPFQPKKRQRCDIFIEGQEQK